MNIWAGAVRPTLVVERLADKWKFGIWEISWKDQVIWVELTPLSSQNISVWWGWQAASSIPLFMSNNYLILLTWANYSFLVFPLDFPKVTSLTRLNSQDPFYTQILLLIQVLFSFGRYFFSSFVWMTRFLTFLRFLMSAMSMKKKNLSWYLFRNYGLKKTSSMIMFVYAIINGKTSVEDYQSRKKYVVGDVCLNM